MKHIVTKHEGHNELVNFANIIFGNCFLEADHECYQEQHSPIPSDTQLDILPYSANGTYNIDVHTTSLGTNLISTDIWTLHFTSSKT